MLQYPQIEEILGKRPEGLFPVHVEEEFMLENEEESAKNLTVPANTEQLTNKERTELEDAVARLRQERNISGN